MSDANSYYVPASSRWPFLAAISAFVLFAGFAMALHGSTTVVMYLGLLAVLTVMFVWFRDVVMENIAERFGLLEDKSFRMGMIWFIVSEVFFFGAFFGALLYARLFSVPWLAGEGDGVLTNMHLWTDFVGGWPLVEFPADKNITGVFSFDKPIELVNPWGIPALNTLILLTSGVTVTWAHHALRANNRTHLTIGLLLTVVLGFVFVGLQAYEYVEAFSHNLTLKSGIYGSVFYLLTGFHGLHVTIGAVMLTVILCRVLKGHFTPQNHFAFEAAAWYWHFVDVVWLGLFVFVYWL